MKHKPQEDFYHLNKKLENNPQLRQLVQNYYEKKGNGLLPVLVSGSNTSLTQAFIIALQHTLSENNLLDIMPETNYKAASQVILKWKKEYPDTPYYILGFSLGSFLVRTYLSDYNPKVSKVFLLGTGYQSPLLISLIKPVVKSEIKKHGDDKPSKTINDLSFGTYNKKINNPTTPYDWLSKSKENLDNYQKDPLVGKELTTSLFYEMLNGIAYTSKIKTIEKMDKSIPIILLSGEEDPVGDMTKGITKYYNVLKKHGYNVELKLYPNTRHDLLNEESKEKIYKDISQYIEKESIN